MGHYCNEHLLAGVQSHRGYKDQCLVEFLSTPGGNCNFEGGCPQPAMFATSCIGAPYVWKITSEEP